MAQPYKKRKLTEEDIRLLKYQCRPGILIPVMIVLIGIGLLLIANFAQYDKLILINGFISVVLLVGIILGALLFGFLYMGKYLSDIKAGEKRIEYKTLTRKFDGIENETGDAQPPGWRKLKPASAHYFIIGKTRFMVEKILFDKCDVGDMLEFHIAPKSNFRLYIKKSRMI